MNHTVLEGFIFNWSYTKAGLVRFCAIRACIGDWLLADDVRYTLICTCKYVLLLPGQYQQAIKLGSSLLYELKKLDDKALLVEVQLLESKVYHSLGNLPKAK